MEKTGTIKNGIISWHIFHGYRKRQFGNRKRVYVVVIALTVLTVLYSCHIHHVLLIPASTACKVINTPASDSATSNITLAIDGTTSHVLLYDYALDKAYLPAWFCDVSMAELTSRLRARRRHKAARDSPYVNVSSASENANWAVFRRHIRESWLYDNDDPAVDGLLRDMATLPIVATEAIKKGIRLKLGVQFSDGGWAVLKSQIESDIGRQEPPASEIAAFHLDRLLDFCRVPPTVGRRVNIRSELASTVSHIKAVFINVTDDGRVCFGQPFKEPRQACGEPDFVNGSLQHFLRDADDQLLNTRSNPWIFKLPGRLKSGLKQHTEKTCTAARAGLNSSAESDYNRRVLDTLDAAYFDMLIDNWDRHSYGYLKNTKNTLVLFDNGRGSPKDVVLNDFLYGRGGCCLMKKTTFLKFLKLYMGPQRLSDLMRESLRADPLAPVLSQDHLISLDRRLDNIMGFINECFKNHGLDGVILDDIDNSLKI